MFAAVRGKCEDVKEFISEGADVNAQNNVRSFCSYYQTHFSLGNYY